ncbi:MAG TPA: M23 family metallopeptidase [Syntrophales bacterium]|nr:M23 family metallopeptidase [Syntrophales bacterium]HON23776.1 M23 family metallopeptidase [Syntrophales bacterium]HOU77009.1 M23 family metallopeptidase [Syntrophales bacterium]HPC32289.1 M23 family metallopeptidase [Syntrophales bacterium]HQI35366.1 M23 family metallopeptidase [Syntrophales bacterium]
MKTYKIYFFTAAVILVCALSWWFFTTIGEFGNPRIQMLHDIRSIGSRTVLEITFSDSGNGLRNSTVTLTQDDQTRVLAKIDYPGKTARHSVSIPVDPRVLKLHDGPATLSITATDRSLWRNSASLNRLVNVDVLPPQIFLLTPVTHVNPGGTGMVLFHTSKSVPSSGVMVDDRHFPSYPVTINNKPCRIAYFAMPVSAGVRATSIRLFARDQSGNETLQNLPFLLLKKKFRSDRMNTSEAFLQQKMPEFVAHHPDLAGKSLLDVFIHVNGSLREENFRTIQSLCRNSVPRQLWEGTFLRMKDAAPMAQFGDHRIYVHAGKTVGESTHLGVDLASTANAPVEAANNGVVIHAGYLDIYGNMVLIDHGLGIFSLYAHLSSIDAKTGQTVKKGDVLGKSGLTGLAGGDHLHFSILVGGQFVNPTEWWDPHWIQDNITRKMQVSF